MFWVICLMVVVAVALPTEIPGYTGPKLSVDSGYIPVGNIRLFYLHVESERNPSTDPVVFWFQGGPGGASMIGAFLENGPWNVVSTDSVEYKSLNWIKPGSNMACVGFSYSTDLNDCNTSDTKAAAVNVQAIKTFLTVIMPQYKNRQFWFTGESYAGAYVPMLSALVVDDPFLRTNFAGFMVGNPVMECMLLDVPDTHPLGYDKSDPQEFGVGDTWSFFNQLYWAGYVDQVDYELWRKSGCDSESHRHGVDHPHCDAILTRVSGPSSLGSDFDPDDAFSDYCTGNGTLSFATSICKDDSDSTWNRVTAYLTQPVVTKAFHAHMQFNSLSDKFNYTADAKGGMLKYYQHVLAVKPSVHILVYSGLSDIYTVPFTYTMPCMHKLALRTKARMTTPWTLWHPNQHHHAGHWQQWSNNVTYATIRGAGHEVPMYQPYLAMIMFDRFLHTYGLRDQ